MKLTQRKIEPSWSLTITRAGNGFILRWLDALDNDLYRQEHCVVEEEEKDGGDIECAIRLLRHVLDHFGIFRGITIGRNSDTD